MISVINKTCRVCGNIFSVPKCKADRYANCSKECRLKEASIKKEMECVVCQKKFEYRYKAMFHQCPDCRREQTLVVKNCVVCSTPFKINHSIAHRYATCSKKCSADRFRKPVSIKGLRLSCDYRRWKKAVLTRDKNCVVCGSASRLEVDHILPFSEFPEKRFDMENGRVLCHACHLETATYGGRQRWKMESFHCKEEIGVIQ